MAGPANGISRGKDQEENTGAEGEERGRVLTDQDAIPVAGGGNPNPRRERARAG
jgi:hypothetical protein